MKRRILLITSTCLLLSCKHGFEKVVSDLGYTYDPVQDIYGSKTTAWQRKAGYDSLIDQAAASAGMIIDCEPVTFPYDGRQYMIELWKGQYDLSTGSEIGVYKRADLGPLKWECGETEDMLQMSYTLKKNGIPLYARSGLHWWLTGFKPGEFAHPAELVMDVSIDFGRTPGMLEPFVSALRRIGYAEVEVVGSEVRFVFDRPRTTQPPTSPALISATQRKNRLMVDTYGDLKKGAGVTDNSPRSIEKVLKKSPELVMSIVKRGM